MLGALEEEYGVKPMLYAEKGIYEMYLKDDFADYPRWVRSVYYPVWIDAGEDWLVWQYNDRGELEGYGGEKYIDIDIVNGKYGVDALKMGEK